MAHAATLNQLAGNLVQSLGNGNAAGVLKQQREHVVKKLRSSGHGRTNQFGIKSKFDGLIEKFSVLNRDDLAEALNSRLEELPTESRWMPEVLSLLLELSDRPLEKTKSEDIGTLGKHLEDAQPALTWEAIIAQDPFDESGIWDNIERGYHSSGDDGTVDGEADSNHTSSTIATSIDEHDVSALARLHLLAVDEGIIEDARTFSDNVQNGAQNVPMSELTMIRESLMMLHGLPTNAFEFDPSSGGVSYAPQTTLKSASKSVIREVMQHFASIGSSLNMLRRWVKTEEQIRYIQSCKFAVERLLIHFDTEMATIEQKYSSHSIDTVVSIMDVRQLVERNARPLLCLASIVVEANGEAISSPFTLLDALYDSACSAQLSGNARLFECLTRIFVAGLNTYLKSTSAWIRTGAVSQEDATSLVIDANHKCELGRFWYERFDMRQTPNEQPFVPIFLRPFAVRIFAMGKSRAFIEALDPESKQIAHRTECQQKFSSLEDKLCAHPLLPYPQLLEETLISWLANIDHECAHVVRNSMLYDHGLLHAFSRLNHVFCSRNGTIFQMFADTLFWRIDHRPEDWKNSFLLSELAQSTLGSSAESLTISFDRTSVGERQESSIQALQTMSMNNAFHPTVQNVTCSRSSTVHSKIFTLLLQVYRAKLLLKQIPFDLRALHSQPSHLSSRSKIALALRLRHHLTTIVGVLHAHITETAELVHTSLCTGVETAEGIDAMAAVWDRSIKQLETGLLLAPSLKPVHGVVIELLELCEQLVQFWEDSNAIQDCMKSAESKYEDDDDEEKSQENQFSPAASPLAAIKTELGKSLSFVIAGLKVVGRAGGNTALEALAERLEWGIT